MLTYIFIAHIRRAIMLVKLLMLAGQHQSTRHNVAAVAIALPGDAAHQRFDVAAPPGPSADYPSFFLFRLDTGGYTTSMEGTPLADE